MRLIDANLIIYFAQPGNAWLNTHLQTLDAFYSTLTLVEVLGFSRLQPREKIFFQTYFDSITPLPPTDAVIQKAIELRQLRTMSLGDSLVAATALAYDFDLYTHNTRDFLWISSLRVVDPIP